MWMFYLKIIFYHLKIVIYILIYFFIYPFLFRYMSAIKSFTVKQINKIQGKHRLLSRESREGIRERIGAD